MGKNDKIVVEVLVAAPLPLIWERSQNPEEHIKWDIRFSDIQYLDSCDEKGRPALLYRTKIGFGVSVSGFGYYAHNSNHEKSVFLFDSHDWKSLITKGRGIWLYEEQDGGTFFKTVFDYQTRMGFLGTVLDKVVFRPMFQIATEWGFETLRLWCEGDEEVVAYRRSKIRFLLYAIPRYFGWRKGKARSWLGTGRPGENES